MRLITNLAVFYFLFTSCVSGRQKDKVVNDFIKTQFSSKYDTLFVTAEPIPSSNVISIYKAAYDHRDKKDNKPVYPTPSSPDWPLNDNDVNQLYDELKLRKETKWKKENFVSDVIIIPENYFRFKIIPHNNNRILGFSKVIYNKSKNVAVFKYSLSTTAFAAGTAEYGVIVMVKRNGKWEKEISLWEEIYF